MRRFLFFMLLATLPGLWGCRKDVDEFRAYDNSLIVLQQLVGKVPGPATQSTFIVGCAIPDTILTTASGVRIHLADIAHLFAKANGGAAVSCADCQTIRLEVTEALRRADLWARGLSNLGEDGKLLDNTGVVRVKAFCDNEQLQLLPGRSLKIQIPSTQTLADNFKVYYGQENSEGIFTKWTTDSLPVFWWSNNGVNGYELLADRLGWVSGQRPLAGATTSFCISLPAGNTPENTQAFLIFESSNAVVPLQTNGSQNTFCFDHAPKGGSVRMITISNHDGAYWLGDAINDIGTNDTVSMTPYQITEQAMLDFLKSL